MKVPLVTIGIPTYNRASGYLQQTLESALAQKYPSLEIVVSDNCSTDNTEAVVKSYTDPRLRYVRQQTPLVPNDHFNFCLAQAKGDYFLLLHDDDLIDHDFVETCLKTADYRSNVGIIRSGVRVIDANNVVIDESRNEVAGLSTGDFFLAWIDGKTSQYLCGTLFNTQAFQGIGGLRSRHNCFQDVMATFRVLARQGRVDVPAVKASTRQHGAKWTHVARVRQWCEDSVDLLELMCDLAPEKATAIRNSGERFFATINFSRASDIRSPVGRLAAYAMVYRFFRGRYWPPTRMVLQSTALYRGLRRLKRKVLGLPAWAD
jgi:glycosyltransferase involved in cell wall biosynthesis